MRESDNGNDAIVIVAVILGLLILGGGGLFYVRQRQQMMAARQEAIMLMKRVEADAERARVLAEQTEIAKAEAKRSRMVAEQNAMVARDQAEQTMQQELIARREAEKARLEAEEAMFEAKQMQQESERLRRLAEENGAAETDLELMEEQLRQALQEKQRAWNSGDVDDFLAMFQQSDELVIGFNGQVTRSWDDMASEFQDRGLGDSGISISDIEVSALTANMAMVSGQWMMDRESDQEVGVITMIWRRVDDRWLIVQQHVSTQQQYP